MLNNRRVIKEMEPTEIAVITSRQLDMVVSGNSSTQLDGTNVD